LPGWNIGHLVAIVAAQVISVENTTTMGRPGRPGTWYLDFVLRNGTLQDVTAEVSVDGKITYACEVSKTDSQCALFAFYQRQTLTKNLDPQSNRTETIFDFGCFTVDHFDAKGANVVIDFWEKYLLSDDIKQLLRDVGHVGKDPGIVMK
jgi:hypothetical protein